MTFKIPKNYDFAPKLFGLIDYFSIVIFTIWTLFIFSIFNFFPISLTIKLISTTILSFPILLFAITGVNSENIFFIIYYILKFLIKPKVYLYNK